MKRKILFFSILLVIVPSLLFAQLDLEQEVLIIPDTHDAEPYKWTKSWNIWAYDLRMEYGTLIAGNDSEVTFSIKTKTPKTIKDMHVFITDRNLHYFKHARPEFSDGKYKFIFNAPSQGKYRIEFVFKSAEDGWINLGENISIKEGVEREILPEKNKGYSVTVKPFPDKVFAEHVVTLLYEISYNGAPVRYPEKVEGVDILLASWDKSRKEFICAGSGQNVDGQIAASIVFMKPGRHKVFAEFKHNGIVRVFAHEVEILEEPTQREHGIF